MQHAWFILPAENGFHHPFFGSDGVDGKSGDGVVPGPVDFQEPVKVWNVKPEQSAGFEEPENFHDNIFNFKYSEMFEHSEHKNRRTMPVRIRNRASVANKIESVRTTRIPIRIAMDIARRRIASRPDLKMDAHFT